MYHSCVGYWKLKETMKPRSSLSNIGKQNWPKTEDTYTKNMSKRVLFMPNKFKYDKYYRKLETGTHNTAFWVKYSRII